MPIPDRACASRGILYGMSMQAAHTPSSTVDAEALRRHVRNDLYQKFAFASFVIWTGGCLLLFITFAAGNARPVFPAMLSMTTPLIPAFLIWVVYLPMVNRRVARELQHRQMQGNSPTSSTQMSSS